MNRAWSSLLLMAMVVGSCTAQAADPPFVPRSLSECYLQVAMQKSTADMAYLAKEICEAVFKKVPTSLVVLDSQSGQCVEWWFDARGRFESPALYCALEQPGAGRATLACEWKNSPTAFTFVELQDEAGRLTPTSPLRGRDPGMLFTDLGACIRHKASTVSAATR